MDEIFEIEEQPIKVYVKLNEQNNIVEINSEVFIADKTGWVQIDSGFGDKYHHAQGNYLDKPLMDEYGRYNYKLINGEVVEIVEQDKPVYHPYTYEQLVEQKIRTQYTISDELALLRQRDVKPLEFADYNAFCEQCKAEARQELGIE